MYGVVRMRKSREWELAKVPIVKNRLVVVRSPQKIPLIPSQHWSSPVWNRDLSLVRSINRGGGHMSPKRYVWIRISWEEWGNIIIFCFLFLLFGFSFLLIIESSNFGDGETSGWSGSDHRRERWSIQGALQSSFSSLWEVIFGRREGEQASFFVKHNSSFSPFQCWIA